MKKFSLIFLIFLLLFAGTDYVKHFDTVEATKYELNNDSLYLDHLVLNSVDSGKYAYNWGDSINWGEIDTTIFATVYALNDSALTLRIKIESIDTTGIYHSNRDALDSVSGVNTGDGIDSLYFSDSWLKNSDTITTIFTRTDTSTQYNGPDYGYNYLTIYDTNHPLEIDGLFYNIVFSINNVYSYAGFTSGNFVNSILGYEIDGHPVIDRYENAVFNTVQINDYSLPTTSGSVGQIAVLQEDSTMEFEDVPEAATTGWTGVFQDLNGNYLTVINGLVKFQSEPDTTDFIMQFAMSAAETLTIPLYETTGYDCTIDWGDDSDLDTITTYNDTDLAHTYASAGSYNVSINGVCKGIYFNFSGNILNLTEIVQWGDVGMTSTCCSFAGCESVINTISFKYFSLTTINDYAFSYWRSATSLIISSSVTTIGIGAFRDWTSATSLVIPNSVTTIGDYAFRNWTSATSLTIPNSVTTIGDKSFQDWTSATSLTIPNSVTTIGNYVFYGWTSITSLVIPNSVTTIGDYAFRNWTSATNLTIPNSVTTIGNYAFLLWSSANLVITCNATTPPTLGGSGVFDGMDDSALIKVPAASLTAYQTATYWSEYASQIVSQ